MSALPRAPSKRKYSWWWDSHVSPKNSKWLNENLTDMDAKVKEMIKLIEEDADSFARRAEMYYKKRPELMVLVEQFYRAYRALAERYDNMTGVLRQAQRAMAEAFPNQDPLSISDDAHENTTSGHLQKGSSLWEGRSTKQFKEGKVKNGLDIHDDLPQSETVSNFEKEILALKDALAQLELEKEAGIIQYENSLEKISKLELEVYQTREVSRELSDQANRAEGGLQVLRDSLTKLEIEKEVTVLEFQKCLVKIADLENDLSQAKEEAYNAESEKDEALDNYKQSLEMVLNLENKLKLANEDARELSEKAENTEKEVENLKQALVKLTKENESNILQYKKCLEKISVMENELTRAEEEVQRLKCAEELCFALEKSNKALNSVLGFLVLKTGSQTEELMEKQKELGRLWTCLQEEQLRFVEAETNFQKLQNAHSQTQDQLMSLALELEKNSSEMLRLNEENKSLNQCNISSSMTIKEMQNDISELVVSKKKLAEEVEMRMDQNIQSQTENSELKETIENKNAEMLLFSKKLSTMEQLIERNAFLEKSLLDLSTELEGARKKISALEQSFDALLKEESALYTEKVDVVSQLQEMVEKSKKTSEKNSCLENSLSNASDGLEKLKARPKSLEDSCELLEKEKFYFINEKDTLVSQGNTQQTLEALAIRHGKLEERYSGMEKEGESTFLKFKEFSLPLFLERKENAALAKKTEKQLSEIAGKICVSQEEVFSRRELEEELDKSGHYLLEIFILRRCIEDLKEKNLFLLGECQKLAEGSKLSEELISDLKHENPGKQVEVKSLSDETKRIDKRETFDKELMIKNDLLIFSQNEVKKLLALNEDLNLKVNELTSQDGSMKKEIDKGNNYELKSEVISKDAKIELLEEKIISLEGEHGRLETQLSAYGPLLLSLRDSISSLESCTLRTNHRKSHSEGSKEVVSMKNKNGNADEEVVDVYLELKHMQEKVKVIEREFVQKKSLVAKENIDINTNIESAKKSTDGLKIKTCANREYSVPLYDKYESDNEITMKDIMLDKNSQSSSYELSRRVEIRNSGSKRAESLNSTDLYQSIDLTIRTDKGVKSQKSKYRSLIIDAEKELGVDRLEISKTFSQRSQEASKIKILERLNSDAEKLTNLQTTVQDLMKKVETTGKGKEGQSSCKNDDILREQLEEAEEALMKLFDINGKLMRSVEKRSFSSNVKLGADSEESGSARRRKIAEQARRMSEKIGQWQTEVQRLQSQMLKNNEKKEDVVKGKSRVTETRRRIVLRDYLFGALRTPSHELRKKRSTLCVCTQPLTRGD